MSAWLIVPQVQGAVIGAIATIVGLLVGAVLSFRSAEILERRKWKREDALRFVEARRAVYAVFLGAITEATLSLDPSTGAPSRESLKRVFQAAAEIELVATAKVKATADYFARTVNRQLANPQQNAAPDDSWRLNRIAFVTAVRQELGVDELPPAA